MFYRRLVAFVIVVSIFDVGLWACSCKTEDTELNDIIAQVQNAAVVFEGEVTNSSVGVFRYPSRDPNFSSHLNYVVYTVAVFRTYKGERKSSYQIMADLPLDPCAITLEKGGKYLIYARENRESALLTTDMCSRTRQLDEAEPDLRFLRGQPPTESDRLTMSKRSPSRLSRIRGAISSASGSCGNFGILVWQLRNGLMQFVSGVLNESCDKGRYSIALPPGRYFLGAYESSSDGALKIGYFPNAQYLENARVINLPSKSELKGINFKLFTPLRTTVKGKVVLDGKASIPRGKYVIRCWNGWDDSFWRHGRELDPHSNGEFEIPGIYPGRFQIYVVFTPEKLGLDARWNIDVAEVHVPHSEELTIKMSRIMLVRTASQLPAEIRKPTARPQ